MDEGGLEETYQHQYRTIQRKKSTVMVFVSLLFSLLVEEKRTHAKKKNGGHSSFLPALLYPASKAMER
jgi:hypothetical protein